MHSLTPEEAALWARVAATIRPLSRAGRSQPIEPSQAQAAPAEAQTNAAPPSPQRRTTAAARPRPGTTLDGTWDRRLRAGMVVPDRVLDLHGHGLDSAWRAIDRGLEQALESGDRLFLLITGHARAGDPPIQRGKIRAAVDDWLHASRHAGAIAAVRPAHARHGGAGSLYIVLRRR